MEIITVTDLRKGLVRLEDTAGDGRLTVVTRSGKPVCVFVPLDGTSSGLPGKELGDVLAAIRRRPDLQ